MVQRRGRAGRVGRSGERIGRAVAEALEGRRLLTTFSVTNANDSGAGSLRAAILAANASAGGDKIQVNIFPTFTLAPDSPLAAVGGETTINGNGRNLVVSGFSHPSFDGLMLSGSNVHVRSLPITGFRNGIVSSGVGNSVEFCYMESNRTGVLVTGGTLAITGGRIIGNVVR